MKGEEPLLLLAQRLQAAGMPFLSAKARHRGGDTRIEEIVCETEVDAIKVKAWAAREKLLLVTVRVATSQEREEFKKKMQERFE